MLEACFVVDLRCDSGHKRRIETDINRQEIVMTTNERKAFRVRQALATERQRYNVEGKKHLATAMSEIELSGDMVMARLYDLIMDTGAVHE
jgi:hypothetical protein